MPWEAPQTRAWRPGRGWTEADQKRSNTLSFRYAVLMLVTLGVVAWVITILSP